LIVADDLGYGELSCQGNEQLATPNIDSLAKNGIRFTSGYVSGPVCGPTRAGLMTGRYQQRFGFEFNLRSSGGGLPVGAKTIAERLKEAGYVTGMFGKWHLGSGQPKRPTQQGFDWFFGFMSACRPFPLKPGELGKSLLGDAAMRHDYMTDALGAEAAAFIERHRTEPWFVYLPFGAVHAPPALPSDLPPQSSPTRYRDRFVDVAEPKRRTFLGMELAMDDAVGVVLSKLRELDLEERTLIFFVSENGGPTWQTTSRNDPLRGSKGDLLE
jgi:arylsulfatase A-like enzyme